MGPQYMELAPLPEIPKLNNLLHGGKRFFLLNALPVNTGMSCKISPLTLMTGTSIDLENHCKIEFGTYAESH